MPTGRRPRGSYWRDTPDWFVSRLCIGGYAAAGVAAKYPRVALYNDSSIGEVLHVYGLSVVTDLASIVYITSPNGTLANDGTRANYVITGRPAPTGRTQYDNIAAAPGGLNFPIACPAGGGPPIFATSPLAILPPGFRFQAISDAAGAKLVLGVYYLVMNDQG